MSAFWPRRRVLVTGAGGLVGGALVRRLLQQQAEVVCLARDWVPYASLAADELWHQATVVTGDLRQPGLIERVLGEYEIATVYHLAAQTLVTVAKQLPQETFEVNIQGTWMLLEACRHNASVRQVVMASSDKAYGAAAHLPYTEDTPLRGIHPYDASKSCADLLAQTYLETYDLPVAIARCANIYGGGDLNWSRLIPGTIAALLRGERPVIRSDGKFVRDYLYVEDAVDFYLLLAEQLEARGVTFRGAYNASCEVRLTVLEVVEKLCALTGSQIEPEILNQASHEIREQYLSAEKARTLLGWQARHAMEEGLRLTVEWYRRHLL